MSEQQDPPPTPFGFYEKGRKPRITGIEVTALVLSVLWLAGAGVFILVIARPTDAGETGALRFAMIALAVFMPVAMIWVAATAARASQVMRAESQRLQAAIDALRHTYIRENQSRDAVTEPTVTKKLDEIAAAQRKTETALAIFTSTRQPSPPRTPPPAADRPTDQNSDQVDLPLGTSAEEMQPPLDREDLIRALNFPETPEDRDGFAALRKALKDRTTAQLIQAAQDVLTLLSHDGIYMEDLRPDRARPEVWRSFAEGARGRAVAALGGVRDRSSLALTATRMRQDPIFRDAAHHFLRLFDRMFTQFAETASDEEIAQLADTRTARAFMLLGRVAGTFD